MVRMANHKVELINKSKVLDDDEIVSALPSLQTQVSRHFAPVWGIDAKLKLCHEKKPRPGAWWLVFLNDSHDAGVLGYHELTDEGFPLAKVFTRTTKKYGYDWSIAASHELLETLADPDLNLYARRHAARGLMYAYEVCDPCAPARFGYKIDHVLVSDFVYPTWFESFHKEGSVQFDHRNQIRRPFQKLSGGDINTLSARLHRTGHRGPGQARQGDSRKSRRETPRAEWRVSSLEEH